jgi:hypothetical protein
MRYINKYFVKFISYNYFSALNNPPNYSVISFY